MNKKWVTIVSRVVIGLLVLTMLAGMIRGFFSSHTFSL